MIDPYLGREQTSTKHFILRRYLQTLAFKTLMGGHRALSYVDGFSGPWEARTADYSDTSFMIAISILKDAQQQVFASKGRRPTVKCFFVESKKSAYEELSQAVAAFDDPKNGFIVRTFYGDFETAVPEIIEFVRGTFALTFIDPTGWTGYAFSVTSKLLRHQPGEVLINYMFDHINRFTAWDDPKVVESFDGILGSDWGARLDPHLSRSDGVEALFRAEFRKAGEFKYVLLTPIEKPSDRTHFCIAYGTRSDVGLQAYRDVEFKALSLHGAKRIEMATAAKLEATGQADIFAGMAIPDHRSIESQIKDIALHAEAWIVNLLRQNPLGMPFSELWPSVLDSHMLRITDVKDICVKLSSERLVEATWRDQGRRKPE